MSRRYEGTVVTALSWAVLLTILVACDAKPEKPKVPEAVAEPVVAGPTNEDKMAAMLRGHPNSKKICIDGERTNAFFLDYGPIPKTPEGWANGIFSGGWLFIEKVEFYKTSNNTWFIGNQDEKKYVSVYPDVTGLTCKTHNG